METKCIVIGAKDPTSKIKPISLIAVFTLADSKSGSKNLSYAFKETTAQAKAYNFCELITKEFASIRKLGLTDKEKIKEAGEHDYFDLIFAYDAPEHRDEGCLFLGFWNDGVIE